MTGWWAAPGTTRRSDVTAPTAAAPNSRSRVRCRRDPPRAPAPRRAASRRDRADAGAGVRAVRGARGRDRRTPSPGPARRAGSAGQVVAADLVLGLQGLEQEVGDQRLQLPADQRYADLDRQ